MFKKGSGKKNLVGLDIGSSSVKAVELGKKGAALQLLNLGFENLQTDTIVDGQIMELNNVSNVIAQIFSEHQIRTTRVAAGVSGHSVIVKNIVLPQMSQEELQESFSWHAEEHIPFDIADVNLDYELTSRSTDALYRALRGQVPVLHAIGDCVAPRGVHHAILEGTRVARAI